MNPGPGGQNSHLSVDSIITGRAKGFSHLSAYSRSGTQLYSSGMPPSSTVDANVHSVFVIESLVNGVYASWAHRCNASYNFVSIPGAVVGTFYQKSAHHTCRLNRNTTHHAVALTELSTRCFDKQFRINTADFTGNASELFCSTNGLALSGYSSVLLPERDFSLDQENSHLSVSFRRTVCANNFAVMNAYARSKSVFMTLSAATRTLCGIFIEQAFAPGSASTSRPDQLITVCGNERGFMYAFLLLDNLQSDILPNTCSAVSASAPFIYNNLLLG